MSRSRPAGYDIINEGIAITNDLDVDGVKSLSVKNAIAFSLLDHDYDPDVGTIDGPDNTWKVPNIIKPSLDISQVSWD